MEKRDAHIGMGLLAFPVDIDAVLQHLLQDMRDDWFVDPIQHREITSRIYFKVPSGLSGGNLGPHSN